MTVGRRARTGLLVAGVLGAVFALALLGLAGVGSTSAASAGSSAGLGTAVVQACPDTVQTTFAPTTVMAGLPMTVHVNVTFLSGASSSCSHVDRVSVYGLPAGCGIDTATVFTCVPHATGSFQVQTVVVALNTATTTMDTLVVR
jgi:hypothetical protein